MNDLILFAKANEEGSEAIKEVLDLFCNEEGSEAILFGSTSLIMWKLV